MTGAFGEEIVQYKGFQTASNLGYGNGRKVFLGAHRYRVGGEMLINADGSKEYNLTDNNGSVRLVIHEGGGTQHFDYKPFGDTLWTSTGSMNCDNFDGSVYDSESDLQMLGFRMYDNETGRFTTPDLLWSAFPAQTPYHYAYNSPLTYRDPSGLAPEKEKEREELLDLNPEDPFNEAYTIAMRIEVDGLLSSSFYDPDKQAEEGFDPINLFIISSGRTAGGSSAENGQGGKTTGVVAKSKDDQNQVVKSVEQEFQEYIDFDDEGKVIIKDGGKEAAEKNPASNFGKLYSLATNEDEVFLIEGISRDETLLFYYGPGGDPKKGGVLIEHTQSLKLLNDVYYGGQRAIYGIFFGDSPRGHSDVFHSNGRGNLVYYVIGFESGWLAHELFYHGYKYLNGDYWWHDGNYRPRTKPEFYNANKGKK